MRSLTMNQMEQPTYFVQEPILLPIPCDYPRKHCKEIDLTRKGYNLFVIVSVEEEKCFGLENVKEFRVSSSVFDKTVLSFEKPIPEKFSMQMGSRVDDLQEFSSTFGVSLSSKMFELLKTKPNCAFFRVWPEFYFLLKNMLIEPCKLNVKDHVLELNHSIMILNPFSNESILNHLERLFFYSYNTLDAFPLVFVKEKERQVKDSRAKTIQIMSNQVDYGPRQHMSFQFGFWSWKYLRKTNPHAQGCSIQKLYLDTISITLCKNFSPAPKLFPFDVGDIELSQSEPANQNHGRQANTHKGAMTVFRCTRRVQMWEEDQRCKPPDLDPHEHNNFHLLSLIKEEPPDASYKPKTRFHIFRGNLLALLHFMITNLFYLHADNSDLRTNPFQVGEDDMIMGSSTSISTSRLEWCSSSSTSSAMERTKGYGTEGKSNQSLHIHTLMFEMSIPRRLTKECVAQLYSFSLIVSFIPLGFLLKVFNEVIGLHYQETLWLMRF